MFHLIPFVRNLFSWHDVDEEEHVAWFTEPGVTPPCLEYLESRYESLADDTQNLSSSDIGVGQRSRPPASNSLSPNVGNPVSNPNNAIQWRPGPPPYQLPDLEKEEFSDERDKTIQLRPPSKVCIDAGTQYCSCLCNSLSRLIPKTEAAIQTDEILLTSSDKDRNVIKSAGDVLERSKTKPVIAKPFKVATKTIEYNGQFRTILEQPRNDPGLKIFPDLFKVTWSKPQTYPQPPQVIVKYTPNQTDKADDKFEDGIDSVPNISNIKTRFTGTDEKPPMPADQSYARSSTSPSNGHVNGDQSPPEVVNRSESQEEILERELPPVNMAKSVASKFRDMQSDVSPSSERRPVRKITPPREEIERNVSYVRENMERNPNVIRSDEPSEKEDELPPPSFTKNMLARFKEMEDTERPPPSPGRSAVSPTKRTAVSHQQFASHTHIRASPDEGIADTEPSVNGHRPDVVREADKQQEAEELPERGFTKSLLAQWKQIEQTAPAGSAKSLAPRTTPTTFKHGSPGGDGDSGQRDVVRESDNNEEEFLPPPSYTKNMLAKFQTIQQESETRQSPSENKKNFKWEVREAKSLRGGMHSREQIITEQVNGHRSNGDAYYSDENGEHNHSQQEQQHELDDVECDEHGNPIYPVDHPYHSDNISSHDNLDGIQRNVIRYDDETEPEDHRPAPETTKKLLSRFQSMEDTNAPAPSPERHSSFKQKSLYQINSTRSSVSNTFQREQPTFEREQPDGTDHQDHSEHYEDGGEYENVPEQRDDLIREADKNEIDELPEQGTTRNLLAKFQSLQAV